MDNIIDYLEWRGDLPFEADGFNEADNLVLAELAYLKLENLVPEALGDGPTLAELAGRFRILDEKSPAFISERASILLPTLIRTAGASRRFGSVRASGHLSQIDYKTSKQFSATVFTLGRHLHYVAYRGTDNTLVGWKEDFRMGFVEEVEAQKQAAAYLASATGRLKGDFLLGGHSKGGNLAVYAACTSPKKHRRKIRAVYNNDGPGFHGAVLESPGFRELEGRIHTLVPKSSVVGMLLEHSETYRIVNSSNAGIFQHEAFSWEVRGRGFVTEPALSESSRSFNAAFRNWLGQQSLEERERYVEALFEILQSTGAMTVRELRADKLKALEPMLRTYKGLAPETREMLKETLVTFLKESGREIGSRLLDRFKG